MHSSRSQNANPRIMDQLEQHYNQQAQINWMDGKKKQNLYYKLVQMQQASLNERKSMEKQLKQKQDSKIKQYWKVEEQKYREMQRRKKQQINNVRKVNQNLSLQIMQQSKEKDEYAPYNDYNDFYKQQMIRQKREKQQFLKEGSQYQNIRRQQQKNKKMMDMQVANMKMQEREQLERKRLADLKRIRDKHQQNYAAYNQLDDILRQKQHEESMLENYIVNKGANDQQSRLLQLRAEFESKQKQRKESYMKDLKGQLENDTYRHITDKKYEIENEKHQIQEKNRYFSEMDKLNKMRKSQQDKLMLEILKKQVKPRKLFPEQDAPEKVGLGSPVNIGKVIGDDRRRQLQWIQKSLLRQMHY